MGTVILQIFDTDTFQLHVVANGERNETCAPREHAGARIVFIVCETGHIPRGDINRRNARVLEEVLERSNLTYIHTRAIKSGKGAVGRRRRPADKPRLERFRRNAISRKNGADTADVDVETIGRRAADTPWDIGGSVIERLVCTRTTIGAERQGTVAVRPPHGIVVICGCFACRETAANNAFLPLVDNRIVGSRMGSCRVAPHEVSSGAEPYVVGRVLPRAIPRLAPRQRVVEARALQDDAVAQSDFVQRRAREEHVRTEHVRVHLPRGDVEGSECGGVREEVLERAFVVVIATGSNVLDV